MNEDTIEKVIEVPAVLLDKGLEKMQSMHQTFHQQTPVKKAKEYWYNLGPGLTTGAADDDPSGIATYSQTGSQFGFQLLWLAPLTFPLMAIIQEMCGRVGMVTGRGLAANIRQFFPRRVLYACTFFLFLANTLNIGADLGAMAKAAQLLFPQINFGLTVVGFAFLSLILQIFVSYEKYAKYLKWLALVLLAYILSAMMTHLNLKQLAISTFIPSLQLGKGQILLICAILGTTISPYLFFWQTSQEVEEQILDGKTTLKSRQEETTHQEIKGMRIDIWSGMLLSNLVMYFIIASCAATLNAHGITNITSAQDAAKALQPIAGNYAYLLFALGIIGTGFLAVPVLAGSTSYAISESLNWKEGLYRKLKEAYAFYGVIIISMLIGLAINFSGLDSIKALIYSAVANGLVAPIVLVLIILISSNKKIMGKWVNHPAISFFGWVITGMMILAGGASIVSMFIS